MRLLLPVLAGSLLVAACSGAKTDQPAADAAGSEAAATVSASPTPTASAAAGARSESVSNDLIEFEYSYPAAAAAIPALKSYLDADLEEDRREVTEDANEQLAESKKGSFPFRPLGSWTAWKVVTDLPGWLSLSASVSSYQGGAHPNHGFDAMVWDKQAGKKLDPDDMFTSEAALSRVIRRDFCREIDKQRATKRGEPVKSGSGELFSDCIDPVESTVILGSSNGKAFDRIGILVAPYAAGPYAEGEYEVTLPVTEAMLAVVKPEYRPAFVVAR